MTSPTLDQLAQLLVQAGQAHHLYEREQLDGQRDEDWPRWYAAWLLENGLERQFKPPPNQEALAQHLEELTQEHKSMGDESSWTDYAARRLLQIYS